MSDRQFWNIPGIFQTEWHSGRQKYFSLGRPIPLRSLVLLVFKMLFR
jgi:hypothetical protein